ncbi:MAG: alpha/beta hydrolase [Rhodobacteraceae bacterium]|jgi:hypothetical protein|nr:alpha/beta hydrolase [Paracoccaceae bacterium]
MVCSRILLRLAPLVPGPVCIVQNPAVDAAPETILSHVPQAKELRHMRAVTMDKGLGMGWLKAILAGLALVYLGLVALMAVSQRQLQYFPTQRAPDPAAVGLAGVQDLRLETSDSETVSLWYAPATPGRPTILFLHGNAGEVADRAPRFAAYRAAGFGAAFLSYRGYGASSGSPTEAGLFQDARAAYYWLLAQGINAADLAIVGESLGTGVAVKLAASVPAGALVLGAPFSAASDVAAAAYPWLPVRLLMQDQFRSIDEIAFVTAPLLVLHGTDDAVIPLSQGQRLFDAASGDKTFIALPDAGHEVLFDPALWAAEMTFLDQVFHR